MAIVAARNMLETCTTSPRSTVGGSMSGLKSTPSKMLNSSGTLIHQPLPSFSSRFLGLNWRYRLACVSNGGCSLSSPGVVRGAFFLYCNMDPIFVIAWDDPVSLCSKIIVLVYHPQWRLMLSVRGDDSSHPPSFPGRITTGVEPSLTYNIRPGCVCGVISHWKNNHFGTWLQYLYWS